MTPEQKEKIVEDGRDGCTSCDNNDCAYCDAPLKNIIDLTLAETGNPSSNHRDLIERIEKIIDADFDCRMKFKDLNNFEVCVLDSVRRNIKTELEALKKELKNG